MPEVQSPVKDPALSAPEPVVKEEPAPSLTSTEVPESHAGSKTSSSTPSAAPADKDALLRKRLGQLQAAATEIPVLSSAKPYVDQHGEKLAQAAVFCELQLVPFAWNSVEVMTRKALLLEPFIRGDNMSDLIPGILGMLLCVFGGTFPLLIASVEAFRLVGYEGMGRGQDAGV